MSINTPGPTVTTTVISVVPAPHPASQHSTAPSTAVLFAGALVIALIGVALGRVSAGRAATHAAKSKPSSPPAPPAPPAPVPPPASSPSASTRPSVRSDVDRLALCCLQIADAVSSPALRHDVDEALREVGYEVLDPTGQLFDPGRHEAVERRSTPDAGAHNLVAATYRPGCAGHGRLLRTPEVAVFRFDAGR